MGKNALKRKHANSFRKTNDNGKLGQENYEKKQTLYFLLSL